MPDEQFQSLLKEYKKDPTYLAKNSELMTQLSPEQLSSAIAEMGFSHFTYLYPVELRGEELGDLLGESLEQLSVVTIRDGKVIPIPFQFDEYDTKGWVYLEGEGKIDGTLGILDKNDQLVFMYRDTGEHLSTAGETGLDIVKEVELERDGNKRYIYIVKGSSQRSEVSYVTYDFETSAAKTTFYGFDTDTKNFLNFEDFYPLIGPMAGARVLDSVFAEIDTGVLTRFAPRVNLNTFEDIKAVPVGAVSGPVKTNVIIKLTVVVAKVPVFKIRAQMNIFDQMLGFKARINIPGADILTRFLVEPHIYIALDFNEQTGARFNSAISPDVNAWGIVDGKLSDFEKNLDIDRERSWLWLSSPYGWDVFARINIPETFPVGVKLLYVDDPNDEMKFENFPGAYPRAGFDVYELPKDFQEIDLDVQFFFPDQLGMGAGEFKEKETENLPKVSVRNI
ncbi:MAG TPA: hypothetical protein DCZ03_06930 [Gammaproteobacteria bacterium]|nr:hypothetical protein [Gammaproteobacteria bacterium]